VVSDDVADVLAQEAFDALVKLLDAVDVHLSHPVGCRLPPAGRGGSRDATGDGEVVRDVGDEVTDDREARIGETVIGSSAGSVLMRGHAHEAWACR